GQRPPGPGRRPLRGGGDAPGGQAIRAVRAARDQAPAEEVPRVEEVAANEEGGTEPGGSRVGGEGPQRRGKGQAQRAAAVGAPVACRGPRRGCKAGELGGPFPLARQSARRTTKVTTHRYRPRQ